MRAERSDQAVRLTGKAWEIRHYLRQAAKQTPRDTPLGTWLADNASPLDRSAATRSDRSS